MKAGMHDLLTCMICLMCHMCPAQELWLNDNAIGDTGLSSFAEAVSKAPFYLSGNPAIYLSGNPGNSAPVDNALRERKK